MPSIPSNLDGLNTAPAGFTHFVIGHLNRFFNEVERVVNMDLVDRNDNSILCWTFLQIGYMECIVNTIQFSG
ncbi:hypothetical protein Hanom_Chr10g00915181 [Helianthus anomalus]